MADALIEKYDGIRNAHRVVQRARRSRALREIWHCRAIYGPTARPLELRDFENRCRAARDDERLQRDWFANRIGFPDGSYGRPTASALEPAQDDNIRLPGQVLLRGTDDKGVYVLVVKDRLIHE